jgi:hypothetical protein
MLSSTESPRLICISCVRVPYGLVVRLYSLDQSALCGCCGLHHFIIVALTYVHDDYISALTARLLEINYVHKQYQIAEYVLHARPYKIHH